MPDPFRKYKEGERFERGIPAGAWNAFVDAAAAHRQRSLSGVGDGLLAQQATTTLVQNNTGGDLTQFSIVALDGVVFGPSDDLDEFKQNFALKGVVPNANYHTGEFAVLQEPIESGDLGWAVLSGITVCKVNVLKEWMQRADVAWGTTSRLETCMHGAAQILYKESGTGEKWAVVKIGLHKGSPGFQAYLAEDETITSTSAATVNFTEHLNTHPNLFDVDNPAAGYDVKITAAGLFLFTHNHQLMNAEGSAWYTEPIIWITDDSADVEKSEIDETLWMSSDYSTEIFTRSRSVLVDVAADQSFRIRAAKREADCDDFTMIGEAATSRGGCSWSIHYVGPDIEAGASSSG
ncbi:MAG: hypothetical protein ACYS5V_00075 [Planctomycetota bacterium]|jgi:hypothetical protein